MPWNPTVRNRSGEIYGQGLTNSANITAAGITASGNTMAAGIQSAGQSVASGISTAGQIYSDNKAKLQQSYGKIEQYQALGYLSPSDADALSQIKDPNKLAGSLAVIDNTYQKDLAKQSATQQMIMRAAMQQVEAQNSKVGTTKVITDPLTGKQHSYVFQNDAQLIPFESKSGEDKTVTSAKRIQVGPNEYLYTDQAGRPIPASSIRSDKGIDATMRAQKLETLKLQEAELKGHVAAEGEKGKAGPDWWPFTSTYGEKLKGVSAELEALTGGEGVTAEDTLKAPPTTTTISGKKYDSPQAVRDALNAGTITNDEALNILRTQFGMK